MPVKLSTLIHIFGEWNHINKLFYSFILVIIFPFCLVIYYSNNQTECQESPNIKINLLINYTEVAHECRFYKYSILKIKNQMIK